MTEKNIWSHKNKEEVLVLARELEEVIENSDVERIAILFRDAENLRGLVVNRGEDNLNLKLLLNGFDQIIKDFDDSTDFDNINSNDVLEVVHKYNLPEQIIAELSDVGFHLRDQELFVKVNDCILNNIEKLNNKGLFARIKHNQSTWEEMINFNSEKAIILNQEALKEARDLGDKVLEFKIKFGMKISKLKLSEGEKGIKPKERITDFEELSEVLIENGNYYDGARAKVEAAIGYYDLAMLYKKEKNKEDQLDELLKKAKELAKQAVEVAHEHGFATLEVTSQEMLDKICSESKLDRSSRQYREKAKNAREKYSYKSDLKILNK